MEPRFINESNITFEMYRYWAKHPMGKSAIHNRNKSLILRIILIICGLPLIVIGILSVNYYQFLCGFGFLMIAISRLFILPNKILEKQYRLLLKAQGSGSWVRRITFADEIVSEEGNTSTRYAYSEITEVKEDALYFYLFYNEDMVLRIHKDHFVLGTADGFRQFCDSVILAKDNRQ